MAMQAYSALAENGRVRMAEESGVRSQESATHRPTPDPCPLTPDSFLNAAPLLLVRQDVQAALLLRTARPAAGPLVLAGHHRPRTRPAADARVVAVVQRVVRHVVLGDEVPHVLARPGEQRVDLVQAEL